MKFPRRKFLSNAGMAAGTMVLSQMFPYAKLLARPLSPANPDHFFIMIRTHGAMDCTLGLDPQIMAPGIDENDVFIEYRPEEILSTGYNIKLGPAAAPLKPFGNKIAIVNGILMSVAASDHTALNLYMSSGDGRGRTATLPMELSATTGAGPFGVIVNDTPDLGNRQILVSTPDVLTTSGDNDDTTAVLSPLTAEQIVSRNSTLVQAEKATLQGKPLMPAIQAALARYGKMSDSQSNQSTQEAKSLAQAVASAFVTGGARQAEITVTGYSGSGGAFLDTHSDHPKNHLQAQTAHWNDVADVFSVFEKTPFKNGTLFDATTFIVITEFSRTPYLNAARGKDHNPLTNSIIVAGKKIRGGQTIGASRVYSRKLTQDGQGMHAALPLDFTTGRVAATREGATFIRPEHVIRTLVAGFGDPKGIEVDLSLPVIPGLLKA